MHNQCHWLTTPSLHQLIRIIRWRLFVCVCVMSGDTWPSEHNTKCRMKDNHVYCVRVMIHKSGNVCPLHCFSKTFFLLENNNIPSETTKKLMIFICIVALQGSRILATVMLIISHTMSTCQDEVWLIKSRDLSSLLSVSSHIQATDVLVNSCLLRVRRMLTLCSSFPVGVTIYGNSR